MPPAARHRVPDRATPGRAVAALVVVGCLVLGACGSPTGSGEGAGRATGEGAPAELPDCPLAALDDADGPVEVDLWFGGLVEPPLGVLGSLIDDFNAGQDQIVVSGSDQGPYEEVLRQYQRTASTPSQLPDILYVEDTALGQLVDRGQVLPAEACMVAEGYDPDEIVAAARAAFEVDGVLQPGYMNVASPIVYFNKAHFRAAGLDPDRAPETLDEVEAFARRIRDAGVAPTPFAFRADEWFFSTWIGGLGETVMDNANGRDAPPTSSTIDTPRSRELLGWLADMQEAGLLNAFPVTDGGIDHYLTLATEQSSMLVETSTASGTIAQALGAGLAAEDVGVDIDPDVLDSTAFVPGSGPLPGLERPGQVAAGGGAFYILNTSDPERQAASWRFLQFMLEPENATRWHVDGGYLPVLDRIVDDPDVVEHQRTDLAGLLLAPSAAQLAAADPDLTGPLIGPYTDYKAAVQGAMERVLFGGEEPAAALARAQRDMDDALDAYNG
jgi:sn-glycerol 3-phosphate transport system substrate-binding protein